MRTWIDSGRERILRKLSIGSWKALTTEFKAWRLEGEMSEKTR